MELSGSGLNTDQPQIQSQSQKLQSQTSVMAQPVVQQQQQQQMASQTQTSNGPRALFVARRFSHPFENRYLQLNQSVVVGRAVAKCKPQYDNAIFDCKVLSRNHAVLWCENGKFYLKDTRSSNGTFVNGQRLSSASEESRPHEIFSNDVIQFGVEIVENVRRVIHSCIVLTVKLYHSNGIEAISLNELHNQQQQQMQTATTAQSICTPLAIPSTSSSLSTSSPSLSSSNSSLNSTSSSSSSCSTNGYTLAHQSNGNINSNYSNTNTLTHGKSILTSSSSSSFFNNHHGNNNSNNNYTNNLTGNHCQPSSSSSLASLSPLNAFNTLAQSACANYQNQNSNNININNQNCNNANLILNGGGLNSYGGNGGITAATNTNLVNLLREAEIREQSLRDKLATIEQVLCQSHAAVDEIWSVCIGEDLLLSDYLRDNELKDKRIDNLRFQLEMVESMQRQNELTARQVQKELDDKSKRLDELLQQFDQITQDNRILTKQLNSYKDNLLSIVVSICIFVFMYAFMW